jgi:peptidoglycan/xylan/chitin deacetylase (PgdA/CDA1 family)
MPLCRADRVLLSGGAAIAGSTALFGASLGLAVPAVALLGILADGVFRPSSSVFYPTIVQGPRTGNRIALTFDDGPDPERTPAILDTLAELGARATFFVIGRHLERYPDLGRRIVAAGHELGNHSWAHLPWQNFYSTRAHLADIRRTAELIRAVSGSEREPLYRPPVGLKSPELARAAMARQLQVVAWSVHSRDTFGQRWQAVARRVLNRIRGGDIVLLHDGHAADGRHRDNAVNALPLILCGLQAQRLQSVTVSELLGRD